MYIIFIVIFNIFVPYDKELFQMNPPIWTRNGCDAITKLINQGLDLKQRTSFQNGTILHYWAGGHYFHNAWEMMNNAAVYAAMNCTYHQEDVLGVVKLLPPPTHRPVKSLAAIPRNMREISF